MNRFLAVISALLMPPLVGQAATLRTTTTLNQPQVRIADLFDEAGPAAARILGTGPAPGRRIVVEAAQAAAIARQFGVAWRPVTSNERVVIDRPGRLVLREEFVAMLRPALLNAGAPVDADLELPGFIAPLVAADATPLITIEQVDYEAISGRFTATMTVTTSMEQPQRQRILGRMQEMIDVAVPVRRLAAGSVIGRGDLTMMRVRAGQSRGEVLHDAAQPIGQALRRIANAGQPILVTDIGEPMLVLKGARVMMTIQSPGLSLTATGVAMAAGALGEHIGVLNPVSGAVVDAEVLAADQVRVDAAFAPRLPTRGYGQQAFAR